jgi:hypothetical protein
LGDTVVVGFLALVDVNTSFWSVLAICNFIMSNNGRIVQDKLSVTISMISIDAETVVLSLPFWIVDTNCELVTLVGTIGTDIIRIGIGATDVRSKGVDTALTGHITLVVGQALVCIMTSFFTSTSVEVRLFVAVSVETVETEAIVSLFVIVWNAGSEGITGVSTIVASLSNDSFMSFVLFTVESAVGVDTRFIVGAVVSVSYAFVQVLAMFPIADVASTAGTLECKFATTEGTDGV